MSVSIRPAAPGDEALVIQFITDLALYEKLANKLVASEADITRDLFGPAPRVFCDIAELDGQPVGFALWFYTYSTFLGRHGLYLEDLFVREASRGKGAGKALLKHLARRCIDEHLGRFEWSVLDWNQPSIDFYRAQGAEIMTAWEACRLEGEALRRLAGA